jgi:diguanylate cyclase (GGDEF)-like protein
VVGRGLGRLVAGRLRVGLNTTTRVWLLSVAVAALGAALYSGAVRHLEAPVAPLSIPWWVLAAMFCLTDAFVVHVHFRRDAYSFALSELPLVVGLSFVSPSDLILARLAGAALALALVRRQRPHKLGFNLSLFLVEASVAALIFHGLSKLHQPMAGIRLIDAFVATLATVGIVAPLIYLAIFVSGGEVRLRGLPRSLGLHAVVTVTNTSLALIGVAVLWFDVKLSWLLLVPAGVLLLAYRAYVAERKKHQSLEFLYETARVLHRSAELGSAMLALLEQARKVFRADLAEIVLLPSKGESALRTTLGPGDSVEVLQSVDRASIAQGALSAVADGQPILLGRVERGAAAGHVRDAMIAPLRGDERVVGTLLVGNRLGDLKTFDREDFQLFETLAKHAGMSFELIELDEQLKHQAFYDSLTDLPNWALFRDRLTEALTRHRGGAPSVLVFDLDDFKTVNDSLGHAVGDQLLVAVAERLRRLVGPHRIPARLGGDEFAVLVDEPRDEDELVELAEHILEALKAPFVLEGKEVSTAASLGIASAAHGEDAGDLLRNADLAMYKAKARGRGNYEIFEEAMHAEVVRRLELKADLQAALERKELALRYQPIVDLASGHIRGFEALVRWRHPAHGEMLPDAFIPLAEETGLIIPIGHWVLEEACRQAARWQARHPGEPPLTIGVNLSPVQLRRPGLVDDVARTLRAARVDPRSLTLEITESVFLEDADGMIEKLKTLKELGVQIAIDDFGTGYSSLSYLARLPIDVLKIAKPFVDGIDTGSEDAALAEAIVRMSEALGLTTLAEGIEGPGQRDHLKGLGCQLGQGYFFARPLDQEAMDSFLSFGSTKLGLRPARLAPLRPALRSVG